MTENAPFALLGDDCDVSSFKCDLRENQKKSAREKPFECENCGKCFSRRGSWSVHQRLHSSSEPKFQCELCPRRFHWKCNLKVHERRHSTDQNECACCGRRFKGEENYILHSIFCKSADEKLQCSWCDKRFASKYKLNYHMKRSHSQELLFRCELCQKGFASPIQLRSHLHEHSGGKPFRCDECGGTFLTQHNLKTHLQRHNLASEGYKCAECDQKFCRKWNLFTHVRRCHQLKGNEQRKQRPLFAMNSYKCRICGKGYAYAKSAEKCSSNHPQQERGSGVVNSVHIEVGVLNEDPRHSVMPLYDLNIPIHSTKPFGMGESTMTTQSISNVALGKMQNGSHLT